MHGLMLLLTHGLWCICWRLGNAKAVKRQEGILGMGTIGAFAFLIHDARETDMKHKIIFQSRNKRIISRLCFQKFPQCLSASSSLKRQVPMIIISCHCGHKTPSFIVHPQLDLSLCDMYSTRQPYRRPKLLDLNRLCAMQLLVAANPISPSRWTRYRVSSASGFKPARSMYPGSWE